MNAIELVDNGRGRFETHLERIASLVRGEKPATLSEIEEAVIEATESAERHMEAMALFRACKTHSLYDLYPREHILAIAEFIKERFPEARILEVCAGDGRLTRFLEWAGIEMLPPTDVKDEWKCECDINGRHYGKNVERREAVVAAIEAKPDLVVCSWPPYDSDVVERLLAVKFPVLYIGEGEYGCCGGEEQWNYVHEDIGCTPYQICRTDVYYGEGFYFPWARYHSRTFLFTPKRREAE